MIEQQAHSETGRLVIAPTIVSTQTGEDTIVHDMITQQLYRLNDIGTRVWQLVDSGQDVDTIVSTILAEYQLPDDVAPSQLHNDVIEILTDLRRHGLVLESPNA